MKKIILCPSPNRDRGMETTRRADAILRQMGFQTVVCPPFKDQKDGAYGDYKTRPLTAELKSADLLITFGGDGTILHLAKLVALNKIPVLGINMGGLGFIAELEAGELEALRKLKDWDFQTEQRMMLDVTVQREGRQIYTNLGLDDAVIREGPISHVIHLKISSDGRHLADIAGDGVIVATPTGSTAFSSNFFTAFCWGFTARTTSARGGISRRFLNSHFSSHRLQVFRRARSSGRSVVTGQACSHAPQPMHREGSSLGRRCSWPSRPM